MARVLQSAAAYGAATMAAYDRLDIDPEIVSLLLVPDGASLEDLLGFEVTRNDDGSWIITFDVDDIHRQPLGLVHGGTYCAMAETVASVGTVAAVFPQGMIAIGQSNNTHFLRPVNAGRVTGLARPIHRGRTSWIWEIDMTDDGGRLVARSTVTMAVRPRPDDPATEGAGSAP